MSELQAPQLRFQGFHAPWEKHNLGSLVSFLGHNSLPRAELTTEDTGIRNVHYGDVLVKFGEILDARVDEIPFVRDTSAGRLGDSLRDGDIIFADAAEDESVGKCCELRNANDFVVVPGLHTIPARPNRLFGEGFLGHALNAGVFHDQLIPLMQGSKVSSISASALASCRISYPSSQEQDEIGSLFSQLNSLISEHRRHYQQLRQTKSALMQRMFPQEDAEEPELRVKGQGGSWKSGPLLEVMTSIIDFRGRTPKKLGLDWSETGHLALSANNVKQGYIDFRRDPHYGDDELYEKWMAGRELHKGQVLFTTEAPMGNVAQVPDSRKYILSQRVIAFAVDENRITEGFLRVLLGSPRVFAQLTSLSSGGTAQGISQRSLAQVEAAMPEDLGEQSQIAEIFTKIDSLISAKQLCIGKLQQVKSGLLQKMFI